MADRITDIVDPSAYKQLDTLTKRLEANQKALIDNVEAAVKFNSILSNSKSIGELSVNAEKAAQSQLKVVQSVEKTRLAEIKLQQDREKAFDKFEAKLQKQIASQEKAEALRIKRSEKERLDIINTEREQAKADASQSRRITEQSRVYNQLSKTLEVNRKDAKDIGVLYGINSVQFKNAAKGVIELDSKLKAIDATLGQSQRNVGNYRSGFNGLGNSINQLTREFPAFTFSVQTGFLALSNNLPIFFDEIKRTQDGIKAMRAEGQQVPGLLKQLATSFFSFGTVLSIGVTLLTVFGKEIGDFIGSLFQGKDALTDFAARQRDLNEAFKSGAVTGAVKDINELKINIGLAKDGLLDKERVLKQYNETIGTTTGEVKNLDEAERELTKNGDAYIRMMLLKAAANIALEEAAKKAVEAEQTRSRSAKEFANGAVDTRVASFGSTGFNAKDFEADAKRAKDAQEKRKQAAIKISEDASKQQLDIAKKFQTDAAKIAKESGFDLFAGKQDASKDPKVKKKDTALQDAIALNNAQIAAARNLLESESSTFEQRQQALDLYLKRSKELIANDQKLQLSEDGLTETKRRAIKQETANKLTSLNQEVFDKGVKIQQDAQKAIEESQKEATKLLDDYTKEQINAQQRANIAAITLAEQTQSEKIQALDQSFADELISETEYEKQRLQIQKDFAIESLHVQLAGIRNLIDVKRGLEQDVTSDEKAAADIQLRIDNELTKAKIDNRKKIAQQEKELHDKQKELANELLNLGIAIVNSGFDNRKNEIEDEINKSDERQQRETALVERSLLTTQEKADKIALIDAQAVSRKQVLEQKQRQIDQQRARFDKAVQIASIIGNTAVAISKALPNIPLSIIIGAIGAAQLAAVLATPIPKFKDGGTMKETGLAEYGHGTELRIDPDGTASLTKSTPEVGMVKKGTQFVSNKDLQRIAAKPEPIIYAGASQIDLREVVGELKSLNRNTKSKKPMRVAGVKQNLSQSYLQRNGFN